VELQIDPASAVPIYVQVAEQVKALVASRALRPGDPVPSIRDLAARLRINRNTAAKAYRTLEIDGVLETRHGHGSVVAAGVSHWSRQERVRRLERRLDGALVEAHHLEIPLEEVPAILERRIRAFERGREDATRRGD
jgi:GntR family transcriptional regulator